MADKIEEIVSLLFATRRTFQAQRETSKHACSHLQLMTLVFIKEHNPLMKNIAQFLGIAPPSATSLINSLLKAGLVQRQEDENDRRIVKIILTSKGKKYLLLHKKMASEKMRAALKKLSNTEQEQFIKILNKITN